jgi:hypothetical protein
MRGRALAFPCVRLFPPAPCGLSLPGCAGPPVAPGWGAVGRRRLRPPALSSRACAVWSLSGPRLSLPTHLTSAKWTGTATAPEWPRPRIGGWVRPCVAGGVTGPVEEGGAGAGGDDGPAGPAGCFRVGAEWAVLALVASSIWMALQAATSAASTSACSMTSATAASCLSGG